MKRFPVNTKIFKIFDGTEYKGFIKSYHPRQKLYCVEHEDGDMEELYHSEVQELPKKWTLKNKKKRYKKGRREKQVETHYINKLAPTGTNQSKYRDHIATLSIDDIKSIASIRDPHIEFDYSVVPTEMIQLCINTLTSDKITSEEEALGYFTRKQLKRLSTWSEWRRGEEKQLDQFHQQNMFWRTG